MGTRIRRTRSGSTNAPALSAATNSARPPRHMPMLWSAIEARNHPASPFNSIGGMRQNRMRFTSKDKMLFMSNDRMSFSDINPPLPVGASLIQTADARGSIRQPDGRDHGHVSVLRRRSRDLYRRRRPRQLRPGLRG